MNKLSYNEILEVLKENIDVRDFADEDYPKQQLNLGEIQLVQSYGGVGKGDLWYVVYYFIEHGVYIRVDGFYSSYEGVEFEDWDEACKEVKPEVRQVTFYE